MIPTRSFRRAALAALLSLPAAAKASDVSDLAGLLNEPVVSTASKSAETAELAPATTSVITAEDLRRHGIDSLDEAINFLALGMLAEPSYSTPEIGARGVLLSGDYGNHVLLLVDGHALNEPWDGTAYYDRSAAIPLDLVDHVEVILGPGSVLYGSSAMLGVINVITKRAKDYGGVHLAATGAVPAAASASAGYGRRFEWLGQEGELTAAVDAFEVRGPALSYAPVAVEGVVWGGDATHRDLAVPSAHARLVLGDLQVSVRGAVSRRAATQFLGTFDDPTNWERDRWLSLDARWGTSLSEIAQVSARVFGDLYDYLEHSPLAVPSECLAGQARCVYRNSGTSRWAGAELTSSLDWLRDGRYVTLVGAEVRRNQVASWVAYDDADTGASTRMSAYDRGENVLGAYAQQTLRPAPWLSVNAGLRLDALEGGTSHLSPRLAAVMPAWKGGTVKAIYSEAFRAPTFFERYYADLAWIASPDLRPETVRSVEGVVEQRIGADRLRASAFRSWWSDLVLTVDATPDELASAVARGELDPGTTDALRYANASRVESYGLNADLEGSRMGQRLRYGAGITLARSRRISAGVEEPLVAAAQVFGNARVSWDLGGRLPTLAVAARASGPRPVGGPAPGALPDARGQVEVRLAVTGPIGAGLSYRLGAAFSRLGTAAYGVSPLMTPQPDDGTSALLRAPRYQVAFGLRYDR